MTQTIAPETRIGAVELNVASLERSLNYYQNTLGFKLFEREPDQASLGVGDQRLLVLHEKPGAVQPRGTTGLFHFAVLLPDRQSLARLLVHMAETEAAVDGASDHGVSEALYLSDPDGNGIEIYRDRRKQEWPVDDLGRLQMVTEELDIDDLVLELRQKLTEWKGLPEGTRIGHIHLRVRNIPEAEAFYSGVLGFKLMQRYGSAASFVSAGGYHHHIGMNTWGSAGAPPPPENAAGLRQYEVLLPDIGALEAVKASLETASVPFEPVDGGLLVRDPSQNAILLKAGTPA
jgi:catechol 2,3-dioxygenase